MGKGVMGLHRRAPEAPVGRPYNDLKGKDEVDLLPEEKCPICERDLKKQSPRHWLRSHQGNDQRRHQSRFERKKRNFAKPVGKLARQQKLAKRVACRNKV